MTLTLRHWLIALAAASLLHTAAALLWLGLPGVSLSGRATGGGGERIRVSLAARPDVPATSSTQAATPVRAASESALSPARERARPKAVRPLSRRIPLEAAPAPPIEERQHIPAAPPIEPASTSSSDALHRPAVAAAMARGDRVVATTEGVVSGAGGGTDGGAAGARARYVDHLTARLAGGRYPPSARRRGIEGETVVLIELDAQGHVVHTALVERSGASLLDRDALRRVERASPFDAPPENSIRLGTALFEVPVHYELER